MAEASARWSFVFCFAGLLLWGAGEGGAREPPRLEQRLETAYQAFDDATPWLETGIAEDSRRAIGLLEGALATFREAATTDAAAETLYALGIAWSQLGEGDRATELYRQALALQRASGDVRGEAATLNNLGLIQAERGRPVEAFAHLETALPLRRAAGDSAGEAATFHNLGALHVEVGEIQSGLEHYRRALDLHRQEGDHAAMAATLNNLGLVLVQLGEPEKALPRYRRALELHRTSGNLRGEAGALSNIGIAHFELDRYGPAIAHLNAALMRYGETGDRMGIADVLNNLGTVHLEAGQLDDAARYLAKALEEQTPSGDPRSEAATLHNLGQLNYQQGRLDEAERWLRRALDLQRQTDDLWGAGLTLFELAQVARDHGRPKRALADALEAVEIVESLRADLLNPGYRASLLSNWRELYELHIDLLMDMARKDPEGGYVEQALTVAESARARGLLEILGEAKARIRRDLEPTRLRAERELRRRLSARASLRRRLLRDGDTTGATLLAEEIETLLEEYRRLDEMIRVRNPRYADLTRPEPLPADAIRNLVGDDTVLLEYSLGEQKSYLWAVTHQAITGWALPDRHTLELAAKRLHQLLGQSQARAFLGPATVAAADLGAIILGPAEKQLRGRRVAIVADGALETLPFAVLTVGGRPLGQGREVITLPSASVLASIRRDFAERQPADDKTIAILADPIFAAEDPRLARSGADTPLAPGVGAAPQPPLPREPEPLPRLIHSRQEALRIAAMAPEGHRLLALGLSARRELVTGGELATYRIVHFATHAILDDERPELSSLVLSQFDAQGQFHDGHLRLLDIYNLQLPAELVVLSACRTALGRAVRGEGLIGLTRGFFHAGARQVLISLWDVDDEATAALMERFYHGLLIEGLTAPVALREAQAKLAAIPRWRAPYYWAGFVLQGDWR